MSVSMSEEGYKQDRRRRKQVRSTELSVQELFEGRKLSPCFIEQGRSFPHWEQGMKTSGFWCLHLLAPRDTKMATHFNVNCSPSAYSENIFRVTSGLGSTPSLRSSFNQDAPGSLERGHSRQRELKPVHERTLYNYKYQVVKTKRIVLHELMYTY